MEVFTTYAILKIIWWLLLGVLLMGLAIMVGMDMGVGTILRYVGRTDEDRRAALNIIGPHWDGNQVWFILGGGAIFAAWPTIYATAFSGLYVVMLVLLWSMIIRPLGFEYRSKLPSHQWRNVWDWALFVSGFVPMLVYGAAMGNIFMGFPFHFLQEGTAVSVYTGSFIKLFNPFAILAGLVSVSMSALMGSLMLMNRGEGALYTRARRVAMIAGPLALVLFTLAGIWVARMAGFVINGPITPGMPSSPLPLEPVAIVAGGWLHNYASHPVLWILPLITYASVALATLLAGINRSHVAWWLGALGWIGILATVAASTFPFIMPSVTDPGHSLMVWNASSSANTLGWMLGWSIVFVPTILIYTSWCYWVMRGKVSAKQVASDDHAY